MRRGPLSNIQSKCERQPFDFEGREIIGGYCGETYRRSVSGEGVYLISIRGLDEQDLTISGHERLGILVFMILSQQLPESRLDSFSVVPLGESLFAVSTDDF